MLLLLACSLGSTPAEFINGMAVGINLGNVLDAPEEGRWAAPAEERYFDDYVSAGFRSVRVPVRWDMHTSRQAPYAIDPQFLDRVEQVLDWSLKRNLYTIVNAHHDE